MFKFKSLVDLIEAVGDEYVLHIENGAFINVPVYEKHRRGQNWMASVQKDPKSPGGLKREFAERARGDEYYYIVPKNWRVGDFVEFGADYFSSGGRRTRTRWYGVIVSITPSKWVLKEVSLSDVGKISVEGRDEVTIADEDVELLKELVMKYGKEEVIELVKSFRGQ